ncbi:MAG: metalloprotease TldD [Alphaproteobacteria bacterium]|nr:metalloprotease TldD [Alphaproteobacteria bacterium]
MSDALDTTDKLFFAAGGLDRDAAERDLKAALQGADDGELYLEYQQCENFVWDDGKLKAASFDTTQGFGLRAVAGEATGYAHASVLDPAALTRAAAAVAAVRSGYSGTLAEAPGGTNRQLYAPENPLHSKDFAAKIALLQEIDAYARARDARIKQVSVALNGVWQAVQIIRPGGTRVADIRPLVRLNVSIVAKQGDRMESGYDGGGARTGYERYFDPTQWRKQVDEALRQALVNLEAIPAPAGEMSVVMNNGWAGVLLHEAIGHGLEGDFNRKGTSAFSKLMGERIAVPGVTIVDDGTLDERRGSLTIDDEGTPTQCTTLIEDGILTGFIYDRLNARLTGKRSTGNGRRESFAHQPMPRMTNTLMRSGNHSPEEIIASVKHGLFAANFGGGQVDITNGKFVFSLSEAYRIENGKLKEPVKGATLIGTGFESLKKISMVGNDSKLDDGVGTCGKDGQSVPVGVGQPTMRLEEMTVGGTG